MDASLLRSLLLTPPPDFVAARNAAAKELRGEGRRDDAGRIAAVRRPSWIDWALNRAAADDPAAAGAFADAAATMRAAQEAAVAGRRADVATALRAVRETTAALAKAADAALRGAGRRADRAGITERLAHVAADPAACDALRDGLFRDGDAEHEAGADDAVSGLPDTDAVAPRPRRAATVTPAPPTRTRAPRPQKAAAAAPPPEPVADTAAVQRRLRREIAAAEDAQRAADRDAARAARHADEAAHARGIAERAAEKAQAELRTATERADAAAQRRDAAQAEAARAAEQLAALRERLERAEPR